MNKKLMENNKGDVPITILVIGVFAICSLAILTFFISDFKISNSFVGIEVMDKINTLSEEYKFYSAVKGNVEDMDDYFNWTEENGIKYFEFEKSYDKFVFSKLRMERIILFYVKAPVPVK